MKIVGVKFLQGNNTYQEYFFKTAEEDLAVDDLVLVDSLGYYQAARVSNADVNVDKITFNVTKWVVCKLDFSKFEKALKDEKRMKEVQQKMEKRKKELEDIHIYEVLAKEDPEMKELLTEYLGFLK